MSRSGGLVVWLTGLSGSGKSTLCHALSGELTTLGHNVTTLDGDEIRRGLSADLGFSAADRDENIRRIICVAKLLSDSGLMVLVAAISPFERMRLLARETLPCFLEVYVAAPLEECERRDPKGLYKLVRDGRIPSFTGISSVYEIPRAPDVVCETHRESILDSSTKIRDAILQLWCQQPNNATVTSSRRKTIAVDFDGVLADYDGWKGPNNFGPIREDVRDVLTLLRHESWKIVVHTTRSSDLVATYLTKEAVPFDEVNCNSDYMTSGTKPVATIYWDDRALRYTGNAKVDLTAIRNFCTWSGRS